MHIPDGYLGPLTSGVIYLAMLPIWAMGSAKVKRDFPTKRVPLLAISAAFSFVIMMFNVPIPGGTTGHAVGSVLAGILLGPWAASIVISVVLIIQALLFGDGGITAIGANCFNMAFVEVFVGYYIYKLISGSSPISSLRRAIAGGIGGYIGLNIASLTAAIQFGIQPLLHKTPDGKFLYCPYGLNVAIPSMMIEHLLIFGWMEGIVTFLVLRYLQKREPDLLEIRKEIR
ncbi:MAG: cobalt transporter CbiM [Candidatus Omnitrophica bacterium]|nr:cobalt transporter CbiM [Candidatus Omnitrophota bacterium]MCM8824009.1 cobalt transporter CbiM [Candidatus Omnitrophota bacterium]MCM8827308.1 cobalt transporter CbiM [Candidatus Omnitrophota bacterium]